MYTSKTNSHFAIDYVSPNLKKTFGYDPQQILQSSRFWPALIHPEDRQLKPLKLHRASDERPAQGEYYEYRLRLPDGQYRWISDTRTIIRDPSGSQRMMIGTLSDIHQQKSIELQLATEEQRLRISLDCANMATWDWVIETGEVIWSDNMCEKLGLPADMEPTFDHFMQIVHPEDRGHVRAAFRQSLVRDEAFDLEYRIVWPDSSVHWLHSIAGIVNDDDGNPVRLVGVLYETTQHKQVRLAPPRAAEAV